MISCQGCGRGMEDASAVDVGEGAICDRWHCPECNRLELHFISWQGVTISCGTEEEEFSWETDDTVVITVFTVSS